MKAAKGNTSKHAGSSKHAAASKHQPTQASATAKASAKAAAKAKAIAAAKAHVHTVAKGASHAKPAKWSPAVAVACCAVEALAAALRLAGRQVSDADVLELYWRATDDPDGGLTLPAAFAAAAEFGLAGVRLAGARPAVRVGSGVVLGVDLAERHAVTVDGHGVWTWGSWRPVSCGLLESADEAWELTWL
jgi:hypothetical protein